MSQDHKEWLQEELPKLVREGIISEETANQIRKYYGPILQKDWKQKWLFIFGLLGAVLIGSGIILLVAHNWAQLSRLERAGLVIAGLLVAQGLVGWVIKNRWNSSAWREGSAVFLMLVLGAAIALISQTYNFPPQIDNFLLTWMLLSVPLVYLLQVTLPAIGYLVGVIGWGLAVGTQVGWLLFWLLVGIIIPHYIRIRRFNVNSRINVILSWTLAICSLFGVGFMLGPDFAQLGWLVYLTYFTSLILLGERIKPKVKKLWQQSFRIIGYLGLIVIIYLLGNEVELMLTGGYQLISYLEIGIISLLYLGGAFINWQRETTKQILFAVAPVIGLLGVLIGGGANFNLVLYNGYLLALGVTRISRGLKRASLRLVNLGIAIIALQIVGRFFFLDISFLIRALVFIGVGIGFLITNLLVQRRMEAE